MSFKINILGSSAAVPTKYRNLSSQTLEHNQTLFLIDCGEGAQLQMLQYGIKRNRIDYIFISHLHGDHYLGLSGFLNTLSMEGRTKPINLYAPEALLGFLKYTLELSEGDGWHFPLNFVPLKDNSNISMIFENNHLTIEAVPLFHRIPTWGFIFREKTKDRNIKPEFISAYQPNIETIKIIKKGADFMNEAGIVIPNAEITMPSRPLASYAYFSDTCYNDTLIQHLDNVHTLYHEATFSDAEAHLAGERFHTTARQAAMLAQQAKVERLLLGHISARFLNDASALEQQAKTVFLNTIIVADGDVYEIP
jgi:ribonuclease Z